MIETSVTILARHLLHLAIVLDEQLASLEEKAQLFLEVFGNVTIREKTNLYILQKCKELISVLTETTTKGKLAGMVDFGQLKFRERDDIEFVLQFWRREKSPFNIKELWDHRLRSYLKKRYDTRENVFDWDYHMKLLERVWFGLHFLATI